MYETGIEKYINTLTKEEYREGGNVLPYRLSVPKDFGNRQYPVVLFMHGAGERGQDNDLQLRTAIEVFLEKNPVAREAIYIVPQCPEDRQWVNTPWAEGSYSIDEIPETWETSSAVKVLLSVVEKYNADRDRLYVMGLSMGGFATWDILMRHGELFAAAMPICGGADPSQAVNVKDIPIHTFHGDIDDTVPVEGTREMAAAISAFTGNKLIYTELKGWGHGIWDEACSANGIGEWMFSKRLSDRK